MAKVVIQAGRLQLVLQTPVEVLAWIASLPAADQAEVSPEWMARVRSTPAGDPWALSYSVVELGTGVKVGGCAFKGPPDRDGMVELAYGIDEPYRGRGLATEVARGLTEFAFGNASVRKVQGHAKPDNVASARVLAKCGFLRVGEVIDAEDGLVVRWEKWKPGTNGTVGCGP